MSLLNQRHLFLSNLLYHQSQLFLAHPPKDRAFIAKELRVLLCTQVASQDRVILANCVLLWPHWASENLYGIDTAHCPGLATLVESPGRLPPGLASELGFIIAILGFYNAQISRPLAETFLAWFNQSLRSNLHFKTTILAMLLSPHPPLPPPLLPSVNADPQLLIAKFKLSLVDLGLQLLRVKCSLPLLSFFLTHHLERTVSTVLFLLEKEKEKEREKEKESTHSHMPQATSAPSGQSSKSLVWPLLARISTQQPHVLLQILAKRLCTNYPPTGMTPEPPKFESKKRGGAPYPLFPSSTSTSPMSVSASTTTTTSSSSSSSKSTTSGADPAMKAETGSVVLGIPVQFSGGPFKPVASTPPFQPTLATYHLLQWLLLVLSPKAATAAAMPTASSSAASHPIPFHPPPDQDTLNKLSKWVLTHLFPLLALLIQHHPPAHALVMELMEAMPEKHLDAWVALFCHSAMNLATTKAVCEWAERLGTLLAGATPRLSPLALQFLATDARGSPLWVLRAKFPNSEAVLDLLDARLATCYSGAVRIGTVLSCALLFEHLRRVLFAQPTGQLPPVHAPVLFAERLLRCVPYGQHDADTHCAEFFAFLREQTLNEHNTKAHAFLRHWLTEIQGTPGTAAMLVELACLAHAPMALREATLQALQRCAEFLEPAHVASLVESILNALAPDMLKMALAPVLEQCARQDPTSQAFDAAVTDAIMVHLTYPDTLANCFLPVAAALPAPFATSSSLQTFQQQVLHAPHTGLFRQNHFSLLVDPATEPSLAQLRAVFHQTSGFALSPLLWQSDAALVFYAAFELSRYCLLTRLKTPVGSSSQTLLRLEQLAPQRLLIALTVGFLEKWVQAALFQYTPNGSGGSSGVQNAAPKDTWAAVPKPSCVYFTANKQGMLFWFHKLRRPLANVYRRHAMLGEVLWNEPLPQQVPGLVWLGWEDCLLHPGYRALAQDRVESARGMLPKDEVLAYLLISDYQSLETCLRERTRKTTSQEDPLCWSILQTHTCADPVEPVLGASALTHVRAALLENRPARVLTEYASVLAKAWVPFHFLDRHRVAAAPLPLLRRQRKLGNFALARALARGIPDLPPVEQLKLNVAEGQIVGLEALHRYPKLLAKQLLQPTSQRAAAAHLGLFKEYLAHVPPALITPWFPARTQVPPVCAALFYALHLNPANVQPWRHLALYFADLAESPDSDSVLLEKAMRAMIRYLSLETRVHAKSQSLALRLLSLLPMVPPSALVSAQNTSPDIWVMWVPQLVTLFRAHPPELAQWAADVLQGVAQAHPAACIYPILVACKEEHPPLLNAFPSVALVTATRVFIQHALKLTVLWEEIWFHELLHLQSMFYKQQCSMDHVLSHVQFLKKSCLQFPTTNHEAWFQQFFEAGLDDALHAFEAEAYGSLNDRKPIGTMVSSPPLLSLKAMWQPFRDLIHQLSALVNKSRTLHLEDLGYFLDLDLSDVYLPGTTEKLASLHSEVWVLPTKTKPKKIMLLSQTGKKHTYLVKGREDLHLDQRMMQFMEMVNAVLPEHLAKAHVYSVVPLGKVAGIIQWIDAVSIYALYKRHHQQLFHQPPPKPAQAFNAHAQKLLLPPTKQLPHAAHALRDPCTNEQLVTIYRALCAESTDQLLRNELLFQSTTTYSYLCRTRAFTHSVALTSVLGYFMGLGDRHLDNILFVAEPPQVVHIDYAICFDRGADPRILKVPERVPFRLTRNFVAGMDRFYPTSFQNIMHDVVTCLQKHAPDIIRLLESYVQHVAASPAPSPAHAVVSIHEHLGQEMDDPAEESADRLSAGQHPKNKAGDSPALISSHIVKDLSAKLQGQVNSSTLPTDQFVKWLIAQATDETNLASMYEGWLPWL